MPRITGLLFALDKAHFQLDDIPGELLALELVAGSRGVLEYIFIYNGSYMDDILF
jgi:hypothetical protein